MWQSRHIRKQTKLLLDLAALTCRRAVCRPIRKYHICLPFLSFWSDWDGSNRPSGQGHQLVAAVVMENVRRMARILNLLLQADPTIPVNPELVSELRPAYSTKSTLYTTPECHHNLNSPIGTAISRHSPVFLGCNTCATAGYPAAFTPRSG